MAREEKAIFTNLCMISDGKGNVLVEDRKDPSWPGICFPGGHVEPGEAFTDSVVREVFEETGLTIHDPRLCGVKQFPTENGARYVVFFYKATQFSGQIKSSDEGEVFWIPREKLAQYRCVSDFLDMINVMESPELNEFQYVVRGDDWQIRLL
jgi:8-oxo-dGTP diphosphatase